MSLFLLQKLIICTRLIEYLLGASMLSLPLFLFGMSCAEEELVVVVEPVIIGDGYKGILIPSGNFEMGCTSEQGSDCDNNEEPVHKVTISRDFYLMESEVTQGLYESVMGRNPSGFSSCGSDCPVEQVSWFDAVKFANALSRKEGLEKCYQIGRSSVRWPDMDCNGWRLPTEAEWKYASRGKESFKYAGSNEARTVSWYDENSGRKTHEVCSLERNGHELCDMSGNVWEWTWDWYGDYTTESQLDPTGTSGSYRVICGGSWGVNVRYSRTSYRSYYSPASTFDGIGFRLGRIP
jgi:formylglycine-generating enzyme required for sulfatase activity